ncbi:YdcF family protein [Aureibaculum sp. 2210JD6-5]|uniref:YdcF family protein n=1 Tax=Aureibaculum sp. 2210JD6-5 TaxID=3103957 RepID=UPI002AAE54F9|nr:YdcF family protein [Aureibaculum sp. 2210JD6-5]MDY7394166.1 YdcF family protein [Aureibaculum sp. 2210JD6-5]
MQEIFIILGSPNSPAGELSQISKSRLNCCVQHYKEGNLVLCTGGWGAHFNVAKKPHALFAKKYLVESGVAENDFLDFALSSNTVDDAVKIKPIIAILENPKLTVITSDYHIKRVKLIFNEILADYKIKYIGVINNLPSEELDALVCHEKTAIDLIVKNGLYY